MEPKNNDNQSKKRKPYVTKYKTEEEKRQGQREANKRYHRRITGKPELITITRKHPNGIVDTIVTASDTPEEILGKPNELCNQETADYIKNTVCDDILRTFMDYHEYEEITLAHELSRNGIDLHMFHGNRELALFKMSIIKIKGESFNINI